MSRNTIIALIAGALASAACCSTVGVVGIYWFGGVKPAPAGPAPGVQALPVVVAPPPGGERVMTWTELHEALKRGGYVTARLEGYGNSMWFGDTAGLTTADIEWYGGLGLLRAKSHASNADAKAAVADHIDRRQQDCFAWMNFSFYGPDNNLELARRALKAD